MAGSITVSGESEGDPGGSRVFGPFTIQATQPSGDTDEIYLGSGDNTINVPAGRIAALILTPVTTATLKIRSSLNSSDGGMPMNTNGEPFLYPFPSPAPTSLIINASVAQTAPLTIELI